MLLKVARAHVETFMSCRRKERSNTRMTPGCTYCCTLCLYGHGMVPYGTRLPLKFVEFWRYGQTDSCYFVSNFFVEISMSGSTFVEEELQVYHVFCYKF